MGEEQETALLEEINALQREVETLSEAVADCRATRVRQQSELARLRRELGAARGSRTGTPSARGSSTSP